MVVDGCSVHGRCPSELSWFLNAIKGKWRTAPSAPTRQFGACMTLVPGAGILLLLGGQVTSPQTMNRPNVTGVSFFQQGTKNWYHLQGCGARTSHRTDSVLVLLCLTTHCVLSCLVDVRQTSERRLVETTNMIVFDPREDQGPLHDRSRCTWISYVWGIRYCFSSRYVHCALVSFLHAMTYMIGLHYDSQVSSFVLTVFVVRLLLYPHAVIAVVVFPLVTLQILFLLPFVKPNIPAGIKREMWELAIHWTGWMIAAMGLVNCALGILFYVLPRG